MSKWVHFELGEDSQSSNQNFTNVMCQKLELDKLDMISVGIARDVIDGVISHAKDEKLDDWTMQQLQSLKHDLTWLRDDAIVRVI